VTVLCGRYPEDIQYKKLDEFKPSVANKSKNYSHKSLLNQAKTKPQMTNQRLVKSLSHL